jgi:hypothetical protein
MCTNKIYTNKEEPLCLYKLPVASTVKVLLILSLIVIQSSCKKFIEVDAPSTSTNSSVVYSTDATAIAVLTDIYRNLSASSRFAQGGLTTFSFYGGLSADELTLWSGSSVSAVPSLYYKNMLSSSLAGHEIWNLSYQMIFTCNSAIEGLNNSTKLTAEVKQQLFGEAKFMRAFLYFYLVNLYGDVPLVLTPDYKLNSSPSRTPKADVYQQIINDLKDAQNLMSSNYLDGTVIKTTTERLRPTKWAATALLARAYLYNGNLTGDATNYTNAEAQATVVLNNTTLYDTVSLTNGVFNKNSKEAIWQLQPVYTGWNTEDAKTFIITSSGPNNNNPFYLSNSLLNSFEGGDQRYSNWVKAITVNSATFYYPFKYKINTQNAPVSEYLMIMRLGEQYLIRAEARAQQNKIVESQSDLNVIRKRASLSNTTANDKNSLLAAILHERQVELFTELGNRWLDLKRTNNVNNVMSIIAPLKGGTWEPTDQLYPIPLSDIQKNPNLIQNPGY